jgi:hypothetical protein
VENVSLMGVRVSVLDTRGFDRLGFFGIDLTLQENSYCVSCEARME